MGIQYRVYVNDFAGGPIDYDTPVYEGAANTYDSSALPYGSNASFGVRAYDDITLLEERNVSAQFHIKTGAAGEDLTGVPAVVPYVSASPYGEEAIAVTWLPPRWGPPPLSYDVYGGTPVVSYGSPITSVFHYDSNPAYRIIATSLTAGATYQFAIVASNAVGDSEPSSVATAVPLAGTGPDAPSLLSASAGWIDRCE